jgi:GntR family carbon starvation induced transcriptional regulator
MDDPGGVNGGAKRGKTRASSVYEQLRADILKGHLKPGSKLRLQHLGNDYGVGNSPLREALNRLTSNGLVTREENKGFRVSPASIEELLELIRTRCWLEETALRESIATGDAAWEERVVIAFHRLSKHESSVDDASIQRTVEWEEAHSEYHLALLSACRSDILLDFCKQLQERTLRYRRLVEVVEYRDLHECSEHRKIQDAVLERDVEKAVEMLHAHYLVTLDIIKASDVLDGGKKD